MTLRPRAVGILVNDSSDVLLMRRRKAGREYATLPGGGIEPGETPEVACARELLEEVNLTVEVGPLVYRHQGLGNDEYYFRVAYVSGEMRLGDGPEAIRSSEDNWYDPQWVSVARLDDVNLVPPELRAVVREQAQIGSPARAGSDEPTGQ
ncbi:mutator protein MutT [Deinococcus metalli]|uniref:DNA mismatch repair protein MutT n=1 Tax=Deinococcus metalli TaxID=1141878 RepID=A0A7W8NNX6_9DEIO|nr:NUDIX domain-containing protein [Deinococcus metalli]MBB5377389.1 mutator protein MutT [Deinococcus metalli]GHF50054.1 DNA mismatch repair protein MutT [Deinococcus metalli]